MGLEGGYILADKKKCIVCDRSQPTNNFYQASTEKYADGRIPICKSCIQVTVNPDDINSVKEFLEKIDKPFVKELWITAYQTKNPMGRYMRGINSLKQYKGLTYKDSDEQEMHEAFIEGRKQKIDDEYSDIKLDLEQLKDKWGYDYKKVDDYYEMEKMYNTFKRSYQTKTTMHEEALKNYVRTQVQANKATANGDAETAKKWADLAIKYAEAAKIKPSQISKSDLSGGVDVMSQLFTAVESEVGIIPQLPRLTEWPLDAADFTIYCIVNYCRMMLEMPRVSYSEIYKFYTDMMVEHCKQQGMDAQKINNYINNRNKVFLDYDNIFIEPMYIQDELLEEDMDDEL